MFLGCGRVRRVIIRMGREVLDKYEGKVSLFFIISFSEGLKI